MNSMRLIDADALPIRKAYIVDEAGFGATFYVVDVENIDCAPTIDAVPVVHGRWIHDINNLYSCSECMERETMSPKKLKPYCPNCGAKMDGEADV